ncbi:hypothetical protein LXL04_025673 [Taraxacum kok-saghyz]
MNTAKMENNTPPAPALAPTPLKPLTPLEWESLIDDHQFGGFRRDRWISLNYTGISLFDLCLSSILRKDLSLNLKLHLIVFLEEYFTSFFPVPESDTETEKTLARFLETLRSLINAPVDGVSVTYSLKEQLLVSTTSIFILFTIDNSDDSKTPNLTYTSQLEGLIEVLLTIINRPNHGVDRLLRGAACECLRELERECPSLLSETAGHLWQLCQSEKTHVAQSYVLMLANVVHGIVTSKVNASVLSTSIPLIPFNVPQFLNGGGSARENSVLPIKELKRVMSFLLEWPQYLTPCGLFEFMSIIMPVAVALELQASLLKVKFSGLLYTFNMLLCHAFLGMYLKFPEAFSGQENEVISRLLLISRETQHVLVFRLLALHWLLGFMGLVMSKRKVIKERIFATALMFYPSVFDPLALKALKLDLIAYCSILLDMSRVADADANGQMVSDVPVVKLFEDGLESVSGFKWLPPWSTETSVAFRMFHKLLIGASSHSDNGCSTKALMESTIFHASEKMLVSMTLDSEGLIPVIVAFINRLLRCHNHRVFGERLLQTFNNHLLPKVKVDSKLGSYFPLFEKIAENETVPPAGLLDLYGKYMSLLIEKHGVDTGLRSWSQGSKVLVLCRTILMHHQSSRFFLPLSRLLAFTCLHFPDIEVRDNARIYLRMLLCVPGNKLRHLLTTGDQLPGISPSSHINIQSPRFSYDSKKSKVISSYIHLDRVKPLLVKQSWSLSLSSFNITNNNNLEIIKDNDNDNDNDNDTSAWQPETPNGDIIPAIEGPNEPLRVTDSKVSEIVEILRRHFSSIPDFRHSEGIKIVISCNLSFQSEPFNRIFGGPDLLPALYATVLKFSSSAPYGSIQPYRIPFLLGGPTKSHTPGTLEIVPAGNGNIKEDENFKSRVLIELQPKEPTPGLIDVSIESNTESGQIVCGHLQSVTVGIEDMFLTAIVPEDVDQDSVPGYYSDLFDALWEACGSSSSTGRETFPVKGGRGVAAVTGTRSVKFLETSASEIVRGVERNLARFVVKVVGDSLIDVCKDGGVISDVVLKDSGGGGGLEVVVADMDMDVSEGPLYLKYGEEGDENGGGGGVYLDKRKMGCFYIMIFLPPMYHLLFKMEVGVGSTLVRMRTDHWPCLAYIDDYLEALFLV